MSLNKSGQSLHIEPRKSPQLALTLLVLHGSAMGIVLSAHFDPWLQFALAGSIIGLLVGSWQLYVFGNSKKSVKLMVWHEDGNWTLLTDEQKSLDADLMPSSYVFPKLIVLKFLVGKNRKFSTIIMPDSLTPTLFHKLFLRLKFEAGR